MRILVVCQYYYPEPFKVNDICEALIKEGHDVDVVTGTPNYPMGEIYKGYEKGKKQDENLNGVNVHRCRIAPRHNDPIHRLLNYFSYPFRATEYLRKTNKQYDVIFVYQLSPVLMAKPALFLKKKYGTKIVLYCLDIWPESLKAGGVNESSPLFKYFKKESKRIYRNCDRILVTSKSFVKYLIGNFKIPAKSIMYLPQYAEALYDTKTCVKKPNKTIDLMFAGNLGKTQGLEIIIEAADKLRDIQNLHWHFVGDGSEYEFLKKLTEEKKLNNVKFYGRKAAYEMPKYYVKADAMLVTLRKGSNISSTLPGKVQTYMAAGKPIIGAIDGEAKEIILKARCGYCGESENLDEFVSNIKEFIANKERHELGRNSYLFYKTHFDKRTFIATLLKEMK